MDTIWMILGLEPTKDIAAIKRAYAQKATICHPEENPQGFLELRNAYQAAMDYAEGGTESFAKSDGTDAREWNEEESDAEESEGEAEDEGFTLSHRLKEESAFHSYADHEAIQSFLALYTGKQRKEQKQWMNYFTSDAFLDVAWDWRFTALLLEHVTRLEGEYPVNREFLIWLCAAYQFTVTKLVYLNPDGSERTEFQFQIHPNARFDGQESVFEIAKKGPAPKRLKGNERAVFDSFTEYHRLVSMAEEDVWSEQEIGECSRIIGCYAANYITDKCQQRGDMDYERHPVSLRLMIHFFRRKGLPEELYRIAWQKLNLDTAIMGRAKVLYGTLRELILKRLPELAGWQRESYAKLREAFNTYSVSTYKRDGKNAHATDEDIKQTDAFFEREDFGKALLDRRFVEEEMLHTWVTMGQCDYYLEKVIRFYTEHETAPCAGQVIERAKEMLRGQELADRLQKDQKEEVSEDTVSLKSSSFFRHWLNTGFYQARDPESGRSLLEYLNQELPYLPEWSKKFLNVTKEDVIPKEAACVLSEDTVTVCFHLRYMEFFINGEPVYRPCLEWERVKALPDMDDFFFCLPIAVTTYDRCEEVKGEILRRLQGTAAPEDGRSVIAACLAGWVCSLPMPGEAGMAWDMDMDEEELCGIRSLPPESVLPFELFVEDTEHLYGCAWDERGQTLMLFEQLPIGRQLLRGGLCEDVTDAQSAITLARQMLKETLMPPKLPMELLVNLPDAVYANPDFNVICRNLTPELLRSDEFLKNGPLELLGMDVTREYLEELLNQFASDRLQRLELSWKTTVPVGEEQDYDATRSLVFIKGGGGCACLYFDDFRAKSYALLERPELYGKMKDSSRLTPFRQSKLFSDVIHHSFSSIRRRLDVIFRQVSWANNVQFMAGGIWAYAINVAYGRSKYNLDKQLLADFPMERAHNRADALFYFSVYPDSAALVDEQGNVERLEVDALTKGRLQQMLIRFLKGGFCRLRLTWGREENRRRHIVLLQENARFLMVWLQEEKQKAEYHVADVGTYLDVEGKKYPKDTFFGRVTPAYLIHDGVMPLRNALELLLVNMYQPSSVTDKFAEYASEKPVKARPYEVLWEELVGDTLN